VDSNGFEPVVDVLRDGHVESIHAAAAALVDAQGRVLARIGDPGLPVYWRSAAKPFQAWPLLASGAGDRFGIDEAELAVACASHGGEPFHLDVVRGLLDKGGFTADDLQCGAHPPMSPAAARDLLRAGQEAEPLHNNCSGKHAAMLLLARHLGAEPTGYLDLDGAVQRQVRQAVAAAGVVAANGSLGRAVDGCSAPTFRTPLSRLGRAYALLARSLAGEGDGHLGRIARAMNGRPEMVAGTRRLDTLLMAARPGALVAKLGAEGIYAVALTGPEGPLGLALKVADGDADRARTTLVLDLLHRLGALSDEAFRSLQQAFPPELRNHRNVPVGEVRVRAAGTGWPARRAPAASRSPK
jgi:L-asparaginase II